MAIELERRAEARALAGEAAREEMRCVATAMSVHDGLSGMLFSLRSRLERAEHADEVTTSLQAFVHRARETILPVAAPLDLQAAMSSIVAFAAVPTRITGTAPSDALETSDLAFVALGRASPSTRLVARHPSSLRRRARCARDVAWTTRRGESRALRRTWHAAPHAASTRLGRHIDPRR